MSIARQKRLIALYAPNLAPQTAQVATAPAPKRGKPVWRPQTPIERRARDALANVTFPVASSHKRFARNLMGPSDAAGGHPAITDKQAAYLWHLVWRYRRQIPSADLVEHARRLTLPDVKGAFLQ